MNVLNPEPPSFEPEKATLVPKPGATPVPLCTVMSDGSMKINGAVSAVELARVLLQAVAGLTERVMQRGIESDRLLLTIRQRYDGLDEETEQALNHLFPVR